MKIKEREEDKGKTFDLSVSKLPQSKLNLRSRIDKLVEKSPFETLTLLDLSDENPAIEPEQFRQTQKSLYRQDAEGKAAVFMMEFNELVAAAGKDPYSLIQMGKQIR